MRSGCAYFAVAFLFVVISPGWSQDTDMRPRPVFPGIPAGTPESTQPISGAKCLTLRQRLEEWGKLRLVSQTAAAPVEPAAPSANAEAVPPPAAPAVSPFAPATAPCLTGPRYGCCREQLGDWLTYRPLSRDCCDCCPKCVPCYPPPLYTFFIGNCCVNPTGAGGRAPCVRDGSCGCGHRLAGLWDGMRNARFWPGHGDFHFWHGWDDFLFYHPKRCAQGTCLPEDSIAEKETR